MSSPSSLPYHEKQSRWNQMCLMHALNMFRGEPRLDKTRLDHVCEILSPSTTTTFMAGNQHSGWLGGNYDVNVAFYILENEWNYTVKYYDARKKKDTLQEAISTVSGLLLNVPGMFRFNRHWICYKVCNEKWYKLDSKLNGPMLVEDIMKEIETHVQTGNTILTICE
jgi:hypothetical protein